MAFSSSVTERNTPRLRARSVKSPKNRSTWLIHEADVGVKCARASAGGTLVLVDECQDRASLSSIVSRGARGSLPLGVNHVRELHQACEAMGDNLHWDVHDDFIIAPEGM